MIEELLALLNTEGVSSAPTAGRALRDDGRYTCVCVCVRARTPHAYSTSARSYSMYVARFQHSYNVYVCGALTMYVCGALTMYMHVARLQYMYVAFFLCMWRA